MLYTNLAASSFASLLDFPEASGYSVSPTINLHHLIQQMYIYEFQVVSS